MRQRIALAPALGACLTISVWIAGCQAGASSSPPQPFAEDSSASAGAPPATSADVDATPVAANDYVETPQATAVAFNVLTNDRGLEDGPLAVDLTSPPSHGSATIDPTGQVIYTPAASFSGEDNFTYGVTDADGDMAIGSVTVRVRCDTCPTSRTLVVSWSPNPPADAVQGYILFAGPSEDASDQQVSAVEVTQSDFDPAAPTVEFDSWNDLGLLLGDQVCFRVKAYNSAGTSDYSEPACAVV